MKHLSESILSKKTGMYQKVDFKSLVKDGGVYYDDLLRFLETDNRFIPFSDGPVDMKGLVLIQIFTKFNGGAKPKEKQYMYGALKDGCKYIMLSGTETKQKNVPILYIEFNENGLSFWHVLRYYETEGGFNFDEQWNRGDMERMLNHLRNLLDK